MIGASWVLACGWGMLLASPIAARARRTGPRSRAEELPRAPERSAPSERRRRIALPVPERVQRLASDVVARRRQRRLDVAVGHELPVTVDLLGVAVGAGCTPFLAVEVAARWSPPVMAAQLGRVRHACGLGQSFSGALEELAESVLPTRPLADALLASERYGAPVFDALGRLATEQRAVLRRAAEARARTVPVRLLFPLVFLVLPAFALLTVAPALLAGLSRS